MGQPVAPNPAEGGCLLHRPIIDQRQERERKLVVNFRFGVESDSGAGEERMYLRPKGLPRGAERVQIRCYSGGSSGGRLR